MNSGGGVPKGGDEGRSKRDFLGCRAREGGGGRGMGKGQCKSLLCEPHGRGGDWGPLPRHADGIPKSVSPLKIALSSAIASSPMFNSSFTCSTALGSWCSSCRGTCHKGQ